MAAVSTDSGKGKNTPSPAAKELYDKANALFESNKFEESIGLYTQAIAENPNYGSAYFNRALSYAILSKYDEATGDAEKVMEMEPDAPDAPYVMGVIKEYQHNNDAAIAWYNNALKKNPNYTQAKERLESLRAKMKSGPETGKAKIKVGEGEKEETVISEGQIKKVRWFTSSVTFTDVVGMVDVKQAIYENIILALKKPELLRAYGKKLGYGVLLYGPPGCGKTYIVSAIAGETQSKFIVSQINEILDMYAGNTEKNMHAVFQQARNNAPCIVFFDELDALGTKREGEQQSTMRLAVNQFLTEMDGVEKNPEGIFVIGATNQPWDIDPALKRSGRIGESIYIPPPDYKTRKQAFKYNTRKMPLAGGVSFDRLARATSGYSQSDINEICQKTALKVAAEEDRTGRRRKIKMRDLIAIAKKQDSKLDEWYGMIKKEIISKTETQIVEGKKTEIIKEGKLSAEEKVTYKKMIKEVKRNTNPFFGFVKKFMRFVALYLF